VRWLGSFSIFGILIFHFCRKIDELQVQADEAVRLKDQVDEYRHAAEKLSKTENVMEKYKKKLEEGAELRKKVKVCHPPYRSVSAVPEELGIGLGRAERQPCKHQCPTRCRVPKSCVFQASDGEL
jgi:hypothetical protein